MADIRENHISAGSPEWGTREYKFYDTIKKEKFSLKAKTESETGKQILFEFYLGSASES